MGYILSDKVRNLEPYEPIQGNIKSGWTQTKVIFRCLQQSVKKSENWFPSWISTGTLIRWPPDCADNMRPFTVFQPTI